MKGCKPFSPAEVTLVLAAFAGPYALRDRALFLFGLRTGLRIQELLGITLADVYHAHAVNERVYIKRSTTKRKTEGRSIPLQSEVREAILAWILHARLETGAGTQPLFCGEKNTGKPLTRVHAWRVLKTAFNAAGITGKTGTHSMRKTFAARVYELSHYNIRQTQVALGHKDLESTASYLAVEDSEVDALFLAS